MGKTKTAFVGGADETKLSGAEKYKKRQEKKAKESFDSAQDKKIHLSGLKGGQRVKVVEATEPITERETQSSIQGAKTKQSKARTRGKKYLEAKAKIDRNKLYSLADAVALVKKTSYSKFDGSVELHLEVKKTNLSVKVDFPFSAGKAKKVEFATEATLEKLKKGNVDFDVLLATTEMMPKLIPFAKILGPKGLMPNPKNGTIVKSAKDAEKFKGGSLIIKTEKEQPVIHTTVGKVSQKDEELLKNIETIFTAITKAQLVKAYLKPTMGPSLKVSY